MKTVSELTDFYYKVLYPTLELLDDDRKKLKQKVIKIAVGYTFFFVLIFVVFINFLMQNIDLLFGLGVVYLAIGAFVYKSLIKDYTTEFKDKIIEPLIHAIDNKLIYFKDSHISQTYFERSELFKQSTDRISGNDYVDGEIDGVSIKFSDLHVEKRHKNSKGNDNWETVFKGLFIVSEFNKEFKGKTTILPDTAQKTFGNLVGNWLQSNNFTREELVKLDDIEFEKEFVVYSDDQIEARYILSHSLMKRLLIFQKKSKYPVYISLRGESIYMAIYYNKDLFEPAVFHSLLNYKIAMEYVKTLHLAISIVEELKLNQKLWSKR